MRPPETFSTERLLARKPRREDAAAAFTAYASDPEVTRYLPWPAYTEIRPLTDFFAARQQDWEKGDGNFAYLLYLKGDDQLVGSISVSIDGSHALFGYVLGRAYWGKGYMTEALRHLLTWSLDQPEIHRAWAFCDVDNPASARVMEKAGMVREGILRRWHAAPNIGPELRDCIVCAKVR